MSTRRKKRADRSRGQSSNARTAAAHEGAARRATPGYAPSRADFGKGRTGVLISLTLIALNVVVYAGVWHHDFVSFDDPQYVTENPHVTAGLGWAGAKWA